MRKLTLVLALALLPASGLAEDWGTITGKIVLDGDVPEPVLLYKKGGVDESGKTIRDPEVCGAVDTYADDLLIDKDSKGIANVFVYIYKAPDSIHPDLVFGGDSAKSPPAKVYFDQEKCVFKPHTLFLQAGQTVEVLNSDNISHNTHTIPLKNQGQNILVPPLTKKGEGVDIPTVVREIVPHEVKCDFHSWMKAYWLVLDHPYGTSTNAKGEFTIKNLPVGDHEFRIWHERVGYIDRKYAVTVAAGENDPLEPLEVELSKFTEE